MKQLLILSGKGGTGKTTIATAFIQLSQTDVYADCDVDAPNLHLLNSVGVDPEVSDFIGMPKAVLNSERCNECGLCVEHCRFGAIQWIDGHVRIDAYACEGCGVCEALCPVNAIELVEDVAGSLMLYNEKDYFSTAKLNMGSGTSGKLVSEVKKQLKAYTGASEITVIDGSPGIGCPVIASVSGVDMVLVVTEPTLSGISDMDRIVATAKHFHTKALVCVNKADINPRLTEAIKLNCQRKGVPFVGRMPYDKAVPKLLNEGLSILDSDCEAGKAVRDIYQQTIQHLVH